MSERNYQQTDLKSYFSTHPTKKSTSKRKHSDSDPDNMSDSIAKPSYAQKTKVGLASKKQESTCNKVVVSKTQNSSNTSKQNESSSSSVKNEMGVMKSLSLDTAKKPITYSCSQYHDRINKLSHSSDSSEDGKEKWGDYQSYSGKTVPNADLNPQRSYSVASEQSPKNDHDKNAIMVRKNSQENYVRIDELVNEKILLKQLVSCALHKIYIDYQNTSEFSSPPQPYPQKPFSLENAKRFESSDYVPMPYSSKMPDYDKSYYRKSYSPARSRWEVICKALGRNIADVFSLEEAIMSYNVQYKDRWNFEGLYSFFDKMPDEERDKFFQVTLSHMRLLACDLNKICTEPLKILKQGCSMKITISQKQAACLLANAFFCTFPSRNHKMKLPDINFSNLYSGDSSERKEEKLKCLIHYFERVTTSMPTGTLTFTRQLHKENIKWEELDHTFTNLKVNSEESIEDIGKGMLQADFANKKVGGGVLGKGLVQEEIRFIICPEMIVSRLFTETLLDDEVLIMTGCERFSDYTGYSDTFKYKGDHIDECERDEWGRRMIDVVAMDALVIHNHKDQFKHFYLNRELNKAYCAFTDEFRRKETQQKYKPTPVCTGNWGCGAFRGDKQLKAVIQMMAASKVGRDICYCTFGDTKFTEELKKLDFIIRDNKIKIKKMMTWISEYTKIFSKKTLFDYIFEQT